MSPRLLVLAILLAVAGGIVHGAKTLEPTMSADTKQYSYICLKANQNLCLGISPGEGLPYYDPNYIFKLQIKQRLRNQDAGTDYKKTRWDVDFVQKTISLSRFTDLCMATPPGSDYVALYPCAEVHLGVWDGTYQLGFNQNIDEVSEIRREHDPTMCMTVMDCLAGREGYCNWFSNVVGTTNTFSSGAIVRMRKCWFAPGGDRNHQDAQTFVQALDCAPGCSPMMQQDDVCQKECANAQCNLDNGMCISSAPTPPTFAPSTSPTTSAPSTSPTTGMPTLQPTNLPTKRPVPSPTKSPVVAVTKRPTNLPTEAPTKLPTVSPSAAPTQTPTLSPTSSKPTASPSFSTPTASPSTSRPTQVPSTAPTQDEEQLYIRRKQEEEERMWMMVIGIVAPILALILCCFVMACIARDRRKRFEKKPKQWGSMIDVNQAAYREYFKEHSKPQSGPWYCCCCRRVKSCFSTSMAPPPSQEPSAFSSHYGNKSNNKAVVAASGQHVTVFINAPEAAAAEPPHRHVARINPPPEPSRKNKELPIAVATVEKTHGKHTARPITQKTTTVVAYTDTNDGYLV